MIEQPDATSGDAGEGIRPAICAEIAQLEARLPELEAERVALQAEAHRVDEEAVRAKIAGEALGAKALKQRADGQAALGVVETAISAARARLKELEQHAREAADNARWRRQLDELYSAAQAIPRAIELLNELKDLVEITTTGERRAAFFAELGAAFRNAVALSNRGQPASVRAELEEVAARYRKASRPVSVRVEKRKALAKDTPLYALKSLKWCDANSEYVHEGAVAGALFLAPRAVADAAVRAGVARIVETCHAHVTTSGEFEMEDRRYPAGFSGAVPLSVAKEMAARGVIDESSARLVLTERDVRELRAHFPELVPTHVVDLGVFNERRADGERALAEVADAPSALLPPPAREETAGEIGLRLRDGG